MPKSSSSGRDRMMNLALLSLLIAAVLSTALIDMLFVDNRVLRTEINNIETVLSDYYYHSSSSSSSSQHNTPHSVEPDDVVVAAAAAAGTGPQVEELLLKTGSNPDESNAEIVREQEDNEDSSSIEADNTTTSSSLSFGLSPDAVVQVAVFPVLKSRKRKANYRHLIQDGVNQSPKLEFLEGENELELIEHTGNNVVWILDHLAARDLWGSTSENNGWCETFGDLLQLAVEMRKDMQLPQTWPVVIVDNRDYPYISYCPYIEEAVGSENIRYSFRSLVVKRAWSERKLWVRVGKMVDVHSQAPQAMYEHKHRPIGVRTDTVQAINGYLKEHYDDIKLCHDIEKKLDREIDVSYLWEHTNYTDWMSAYLRDTIHEVLTEFASKNPKLDVRVGLEGEYAKWGRKSVSPEYVDALLHTKIVVVAQRDFWEDHYRLFEAMVAGTLVLTDKMISLPTGLEDGASVVEYTSADDLLEKIKYYLKHDRARIRIARQGRYVAMARHRSWHHMEEIIFGEPRTTCYDSSMTVGDPKYPPKNSRCPYMVSAKNINERC